MNSTPTHPAGSQEPETPLLPRYSHAFAWSIVFLRNGGERLRAIMMTTTWFGVSLSEARAWVDSVQIKRVQIDKSEARKMFTEYPTDLTPKELEDSWTYDVSHWPNLSTSTVEIDRLRAALESLMRACYDEANRIANHSSDSVARMVMGHLYDAANEAKAALQPVSAPEAV